MNKLIPLLAFSILLLVPVGAQNALADQVVLTPLDDAFIVASHPGPNPTIVFQASLLSVVFDPPFEDQTIIEFDISSLTPGTIVSASLDLNVLQIAQLPPPFLLDIFGFSPPDADGVVKLSDFDKGILVNSLSIPGSGPSSVDVTPFVNSAVTNGDTFVGFSLQSKNDPGKTLVLSSIERVPNTHPTLTIVLEDTSIIGGEIIPIETTSLLLANTQSFSWMIPVLLSGIGIGLFVFSKKSVK